MVGFVLKIQKLLSGECNFEEQAPNVLGVSDDLFPVVRRGWKAEDALLQPCSSPPGKCVGLQVWRTPPCFGERPAGLGDGGQHAELHPGVWRAASWCHVEPSAARAGCGEGVAAMLKQPLFFRYVETTWSCASCYLLFLHKNGVF